MNLLKWDDGLKIHKTQLDPGFSKQRAVKMSIASAACGSAGQGSDITQCNSTLNVENSPGGGIRVALSQSEDKTWGQVTNHSRAVITLNNIEDHQGNSQNTNC